MAFEVYMGAEVVRKLLSKMDLVQLSEQLRKDLEETNSKQKKKDFTKRLEIVEAIGIGTDPSGWCWK